MKTLFAIAIMAISTGFVFAEEIVKENVNNGTQSLDPLAQFVRDLSINVPILYGMFSIVLALVLGVAAAIIRKFFSNLRKKYISKSSPASQK